MNNILSFSQSSDQYAKHRPQYPDELFAYLSRIVPSHDSAWDCATGNGQAAVSLARYFSRVEATDISAEQIKHHLPHPKVRYSISPAENTPFDDRSFDLITVASAVHWFNQGQFHREVDRVLKPNGVLAVWTYGLFTIAPEIDKVVQDDLMMPIDRFWAEGNRMVMNGYRDLVLPYEEFNAPAFSIHLDWTLEQLCAYLRTWSAVKRFLTVLGNDPVAILASKLIPLWGERESTREVHMPLVVRAGRKSA